MLDIEEVRKFKADDLVGYTVAAAQNILLEIKRATGYAPMLVDAIHDPIQPLDSDGNDLFITKILDSDSLHIAVQTEPESLQEINYSILKGKTVKDVVKCLKSHVGPGYDVMLKFPDGVDMFSIRNSRTSKVLGNYMDMIVVSECVNKQQSSGIVAICLDVQNMSKYASSDTARIMTYIVSKLCINSSMPIEKIASKAREITAWLDNMGVKSISDDLVLIVSDICLRDNIQNMSGEYVVNAANEILKEILKQNRKLTANMII